MEQQNAMRYASAADVQVLVKAPHNERLSEIYFILCTVIIFNVAVLGITGCMVAKQTQAGWQNLESWTAQC